MIVDFAKSKEDGGNEEFQLKRWHSNYKLRQYVFANEISMNPQLPTNILEYFPKIFLKTTAVTIHNAIVKKSNNKADKMPLNG